MPLEALKLPKGRRSKLLALLSGARRVSLPVGDCQHCCAPACRMLLARACTTPMRPTALLSIMTEVRPHKPFTFRALRKSSVMWVRCGVCRRYAPLSIGGLQNVDYRSKTFSCSQCGSEAYLAVIKPVKEAGMQDYRLDAIEQPERHPAAVDRLTGRCRIAPVDYSGGELPGRKADPRR